jgi:hypothetical protein
MNDYITKQTKIKTEDILSDIILTNDYYTKCVGTFNSMMGLNQIPEIKKEIKPVENKTNS